MAAAQKTPLLTVLTHPYHWSCFSDQHSAMLVLTPLCCLLQPLKPLLGGADGDSISLAAGGTNVFVYALEG